MSEQNIGSDAPVVVVDIGSGAVKLLIVDRAGLSASNGGAAPAGTALSTAIKTRLISGPSATISDQALADTANAFSAFGALVEEHAPGAAADGRLAVVSTAVAREAANLADLEAVVRAAFGVELTVLTGEREAALAFYGAVAGRALPGPVVVFDIGAGSTEFAFTTDGETPAVMSLPIGGRTVIDAYLANDPPRPEELSAALSVVELHVDDLRRELPAIGAALEGTVIGTGAMTQIAAVEIGLADPEASVDGEVVDKVGLEDLFRTLATESAADRIHNPGLKPEHVDDIVGAMCVLMEIMRQLDIDQILVSERSVKFGLAAEMLGER